MPDYIPDSDSEFLAWLESFVAYISANALLLGLAPAEVTEILNGLNAFETAYAAHNNAQNAAAAAAEGKDAARADIEAPVRDLVNQFQADPTITDPQREGMGITVRDEIKTPSAIPTTRPLAQVDTSQRFTHAVSFADETTPAVRKKPEGVAHCEIWVKIGGAPPVDADECEFLASDTNTPYTAFYEGEDGNKTAHYMLRWVNTRGEKGPWSNTVSATIPA